MSEETKRQVLEMSAGILVHNLVLLLVCLIWFRQFEVILGVFIGALAAELMLLSIAHSTELCVESANENYGRQKMALHSVLRSFSVLILVGLLWKFTEVNLLTVILGTLGLKTGAYLYPAVHKHFDHKAGT